MKLHLCAAISLAAMNLSSAVAAGFQIDEPTLDKWMYVNGPSGGTRSGVSVFGGVGETDSDDRLAQTLVRFDTTGIAAAGLGAANYAVTSIRLTLTVNSNAFIYDPTQDALGTYNGSSVDGDAGRPIELFGAGYQNGFTQATFLENSAYGNGSGSRNAYAAGFDPAGNLVEVSNNVRGNFETNPFAIGSVAGLSAGGTVLEDMEMTFDLDLSDPFLLAYVQAGLNAGALDLFVTSLVSTTQEAASGYASFYAKENLLHNPAVGDFLAGRLSGDLTAVPEPSVWALVILAGAALVWRARREKA